MAKKPLETGAPEASAAKKTAARKTTAKKTASTTKKAAAAEKKAAADAVSVEAPKTKIKTVKSAPKTAVKTKTAKTAKKAADEKAPVSETVVVPSEAPAPSAPVEKEMMPEAPQKPQAAAPVKVKRESFRPNRNAEQQERHEQHGGDVFAQPETVGGASEGAFNKRKRRRRNGGKNFQPIVRKHVRKPLFGNACVHKAPVYVSFFVVNRCANLFRASAYNLNRLTKRSFVRKNVL